MVPERILSESRMPTPEDWRMEKMLAKRDSAALGRANALCAQFQSNLTLASEACYNAEQRASYVESHPWRNLWAWVKRKIKMA